MKAKNVVAKFALESSPGAGEGPDLKPEARSWSGRQDPAKRHGKGQEAGREGCSVGREVSVLNQMLESGFQVLPSGDRLGSRTYGVEGAGVPRS